MLFEKVNADNEVVCDITADCRTLVDCQRAYCNIPKVKREWPVADITFCCTGIRGPFLILSWRD